MSPSSAAPDTHIGVTISASGDHEAPRRIAILGNPNTGKTTLFNRLSGLRHKTSNFPGTTLEARVARVRAGIEGGRDADLIDLPGIYSLELEQAEAIVCRAVLAGQAAPRGEALGAPEVCVVVTDAANLARNLMLVGEVVRRRLPTVVVVNMIDLARSHGVAIDAPSLAAALGCGVVLSNARDGEGINSVRVAIREARIPAPVLPVPPTPDGLREWAEEMFARALTSSDPDAARRAHFPDTLSETRSDRIDRVLLHPVSGTLVFALIMTGLFWAIFSLAQFPMGWIDAIFSAGTSLLESQLPDGAIRDLLADGVVGGIGATVIFLPQICLLFFLISLLEDTGYLARGAFLMDRLLRPFGLPGHAFVPLLSSHACALPGIMATRAIPDRRERLAAILVAPFMTCSARLPVYVLLTTLLFKDRPAMAALAFVGCYALGIAAGVLSALVARRTILRGPSRAMALELPSYKRPSLRTAFITTIDRGWIFLRNAGTNILVICIILWWLGAYPKVSPPRDSVELRQQAALIEKNPALAPPLHTDGLMVASGPLYVGEDARRKAAELRAEAADLSKGSTSEQMHGRRLEVMAEFVEYFARTQDEQEAILADWRSRADRLESSDPVAAHELRVRATQAEAATRDLKTGGVLIEQARAEAAKERMDALNAQADRLEARHAAANSFLGRLGRTVEPVFRPLGYDWQLSIGVLASFAAREVFVSTMNIVIAGQEEGADDEDNQRLMEQIQTAKRSDGVTPIFTPAASWSLLVFFVLAMQCLPTLAVTARESGHVKWALLQLAWMSGVAYVAALIVYQVLR